MRKISVIGLAAVLLTIGIFSLSFGQQKTPQYGGMLRIISASGPQVLSYPPLMGPLDHIAVMPAAERLVDCTIDRQKGGGIEPVLAEKVDEDAKNLRITWHIRKGVKFSDGSDLDAEVVRWDFQQILDTNTLPYQKNLKDMRVVDKYTLVMDLNEYSNQLVGSWGWWPLINSKAAWDKASGGNLEKGKEWARDHIVTAGPFMLKEYKRDDHITWVKNPNYWRKGRPYLDAIQVTIVPDSMTARLMMESNQADVWQAPPKDQVELAKKAFNSQTSWPAAAQTVWINTANPKSRWQDKRLREAVEYAIDKEAVAKVLGFGRFRPLKSLPPPGEWGYDPNYNPRPYDPDKARQLVKEAGYPNGLKAKLLVLFTPDARDAGVALKQYLDAVGIQIDLDVADPGRFFGTMYSSTPGPDADLAWWMVGRDPNYLETYMRWFSTQPFTVLSYLSHPAEQAAMDAEAHKMTSVKDQAAMTRKLMRLVTDNALIVPIFEAPGCAMQQQWVHSTEFEQGFIRWQTEEVWMEKH
ncbi:MAG: ABC transporter substrate-binding protein [Syntrophorhabdales bacterium]|jgi:ABC-type transport system substrate-binding protein